MADHLWFIPVAGGNPDDTSDKFINVQWGSGLFGAPAIAPVTASAESLWLFQSSPTQGAARLERCWGKWSWTSEQSAGEMTKGSQIGVGTVLASYLDANNSWSNVDVWAKFRFSNKQRLSRYIYLSICDSSGNSSALSIDTAFLLDDVWHVRGHTYQVPSEWARTNLRGLLTFQGTTTAANVGAVTISVEWFAFRLRTQA